MQALTQSCARNVFSHGIGDTSTVACCLTSRTSSSVYGADASVMAGCPKPALQPATYRVPPKGSIRGLTGGALLQRHPMESRSHAPQFLKDQIHSSPERKTSSRRMDTPC